MLKPLLLAALLILTQKEERTTRTGIIAGAVAVPEKTAFSQPLQVILLSPKYEDLWNSDVQRRLDGYWERFKPAFAEQKEVFVEATQMAYRESTQFVITRMRRDIPNQIADYIQQSSPEGRFEFRNVPLGEYKVLAVGRIGDRDFIWQESIEVSSSIPQFLQLKNRIP